MNKDISFEKGKILLELLNQPGFLNISDFTVTGDITVHDPGFPQGKRERKGQFFISLKENLAESLPGTSINSEIFLSELGIEKADKKILLSNLLTILQKPIITHREKHFSLNIFHGSGNIHAMNMSKLAMIRGQGDSTFASEDKRAIYQGHLFEIIKPVITFDNKNNYPFRIIEDCLASGDTISGILAMIKNETKIDIVSKKIRIDVAVATVQGILVLRKFALANKLDFELNIGYLAYGLSQGIKVDGVRKHANYIVYPGAMLDQFPPDVKNFRSIGGDYSVVGDMGDASAKLSNDFNMSHPWNKNRLDIPTHNRFDKSKKTIFYFANGGYLMRAYHNFLHPHEKGINQLVFSAKRIWSTNLGYGVLVYDLDQKILI